MDEACAFFCGSEKVLQNYADRLEPHASPNTLRNQICSCLKKTNPKGKIKKGKGTKKREKKIWREKKKCRTPKRPR